MTLKPTELTDAQCEQLDNLHDKIYDLVRDFIPDQVNRGKLDFDIEYIGEIADLVAAYIVKYKLGTEMEINPYLEDQ